MGVQSFPKLVFPKFQKLSLFVAGPSLTLDAGVNSAWHIVYVN